MNIERKRRPYIHTVITNEDTEPPLTAGYKALFEQYKLSSGPSSGVELTLNKRGITIGAYYDHGVGIEALSLTWDELDVERTALLFPNA